ncbi:MAG: glycosyltransferase [Blastocatellia bacterium]
MQRSTLKRDRPRLLLLTSSFPSSPSDETCCYVRDFVRSLSSEFEITVLAPPDPGAAEWPPSSFTLVRSRSVLPLSVDPFVGGSDLNCLASASLLTRLATLVSLSCFLARALALSLRADAICSHWMVPAGLVGALISRVLRKPHVVVEHSGAIHLLSRIRGGRGVARFVVAGSDRIVTVSSDLRRRLIELCPEAPGRIEVLSMGVNSRRATIADRQAEWEENKSLRTAATDRTILFLGRLTEIKGLDVLLKAMQGLQDVRLIVAGDGERRSDLERMARELAVNASFRGRVDALQKEALLSSCDAVVIPSRVLPDGRTEGTPVVCLEALAAGRMVIASRVGGLAEVIVDGANGLLFEPSDDRMLRDKLTLALGSDRLRRKLSANARLTAEAYDWSRIGLRFSAIIRRTLPVAERRLSLFRLNRDCVQQNHCD